MQIVPSFLMILRNKRRCSESESETEQYKTKKQEDVTDNGDE
jgi:hypothetical protein